MATSATASAVGALPPAQQQQDIGAPAIAGSGSYDQGVYTVTAGGDDIWGTADQFHYVYQPVSGDVDVSVRVSSLANVNPWAKAGVMIRESLVPGSANVFAGLSTQHGSFFQRRAATNDVTLITIDQGVAPGWVRLKRTGDLFTAYRSSDGINWSVIGSDSFPMSAGVYVGIAVTSHNASAATSAVLANLIVTQSQPVNQPPTASLTAPANGASYTAPATIGLTASASDPDGTVARVDFYNGATLLGSDATAPYSFAWSSVPAGTYSLKATAVDDAGATGSSAVATVTVNGGNQTPSVALTGPANGATFTAPASITLAATASDADGTVARVDFYNGTALLASDTAAPYAFTWGPVGAGNYALRAVAVDNLGASATSATATITVTPAANQLPTVTLTAPANGATFTAPASVTLTATASDSDGSVSRVEFYSGAALLATDTTAPYSFVWSNVAAGTYALRAIAYDNLGASASSATATITVGSNLPPPPQQNQDIGAPAIAGSANYSQGIYTVTAGGDDIWGRADQFHYVYQPVSGDVDVSVRVSSLTDVNPWTKAGVMIRESLVPGSANAFAGLSAEHGSFFQRRAATGDVTVIAVDGGVAPGWVRLKRTGDLLTAYRSTDGINWTAIGSDSFPMSAGLYVGIAVTSHNPSASTTAVLANLNVTQSQPANQPPTASLTAPANGASYTAPATIGLTASASDADGSVARVEFYNGAALLATDTTAPYSVNWSSVAAGTYALRAIAYDNLGASATSATATITVAGNQAPTVTLTAPANGATFTSPASVTLTATASDSDGSVSRVEFYSGAALLATDTTAPYSFVWSNVAAGTYALRAIAYDNLGASATSATATITVSATLPPPTGVAFHASSDHSTTEVTSYLLEIFAVGANPDTATPLGTSDLGKPTPDVNGDIAVNRAAFLGAFAPGSYVATVSALGPGGKGRGAAVTFTR